MNNEGFVLVSREVLSECLACMKEVYRLPAKYYGSNLGDTVRDILSRPSHETDSDRRVEVLTDALGKVSRSLVAAGNVKRQDWQSDNEKRAMDMMKVMGEEGLEAIARSMME